MSFQFTRHIRINSNRGRERERTVAEGQLPGMLLPQMPNHHHPLILSFELLSLRLHVLTTMIAVSMAEEAERASTAKRQPQNKLVRFERTQSE